MTDLRKADEQEPQIVLLDCDGVLVENTAFERRVTKTIVSELAELRGVSLAHAGALWSEELSSTRRDWRWYDYSYHCERLGLRPRTTVRNAHLGAAHLLSVVPGARDTLSALRTNGYIVGVATDATQWVVRYKLDRLRIDIDGPIHTSDTLMSTKAKREYWLQVASRSDGVPPCLLVDNRDENLAAAREVLALKTVRFLRHEHVTTLSHSVAPLSRQHAKGEYRSAADHRQLRAALHEVLPRFDLTA